MPGAARTFGPVVAWVAALGCQGEAPPPPPRPEEVLVSVTTVDLQGQPVEGIRFYLDGKKYGITDQEGRFSGRYPARDGQTLTFNAEAPEGFVIPPSPEQAKWRVQVHIPPGGPAPRLEFRAELRRPERPYALMVRALPLGTPVVVNGATIGHTGSSGEALLRVTGVPGAPLVAQAGAARFEGTFSEDDEVYLLTAELSGPVASRAPAPPPSPATASPAPSAPPGPKPGSAPSDPWALPETAVAPPREAVAARLEAIRSQLSGGGVLLAADVTFLGQVDRADPGYYEAHRLLADAHFRNKDYARQAAELGLATSGGPYKRDPTLLLSLAESHTRTQQYREALNALARLEANLRDLPGAKKAASYRLSAEVHELEYDRQAAEAPARANTALLEKALRAWERVASFSRGVDAAAVSQAEARMKALAARLGP